MSSRTPLPPLVKGSPEEVLRTFFKKNYPRIVGKVERQVRRTPRRLTGEYKTNRACRWVLDPSHPDYTSAKEICRIEAKLYAMALEFVDAPDVPDSIAKAASKILGKKLENGPYRCPVTGRPMSFTELLKEAKSPKAGRSRLSCRAREAKGTKRKQYPGQYLLDYRSRQPHSRGQELERHCKTHNRDGRISKNPKQDLVGGTRQSLSCVTAATCSTISRAAAPRFHPFPHYSFHPS